MSSKFQIFAYTFRFSLLKAVYDLEKWWNGVDVSTKEWFSSDHVNIERPKKVVADCGGGSWKKDARNREEVTKSRDSVVACGERLDRNQLRSNIPPWNAI